MFVAVQNCPNPSCKHHKQPLNKDWYVKVGTYKSKIHSHPIPRYRCKDCGKKFSTSTFKQSYCDKKEIKQELFKLLVSGVSLRRASKILEVEYNTVVKHFNDLAEICKKLHYKHIQTIKTSFVMLDEIETYLHSKYKNLSVAVVIRIKTGEILGFEVSKIPSKGRNAHIGVQKYNWTADERKFKFNLLFLKLKPYLTDNVTFKTDEQLSYPKWIKNVIPQAQIKQINSTQNKANQFDELFAINNLFAKFRNDMNRLGRKTWATTKAISGLENHLWLYIAWNNNYKIK